MNKNFSFGKRKETQDLRKEKKDIIMYGCIEYLVHILGEAIEIVDGFV